MNRRIKIFPDKKYPYSIQKQKSFLGFKYWVSTHACETLEPIGDLMQFLNSQDKKVKQIKE